MTAKPARPASLWRSAAFRVIWAGQTASIFGDRFTGIALPWLLLQQTRSPLAAALVTAALYLPPLLLAVPAGVLADRTSRRRLMVGSDLARAAALAAVVAVGLAGRLPPLWLLVVVVLTLGTGGLFFQVAYRAWLPDVVPDVSLGRATAALEASDAAGTLAGPALAGTLIQLIGPALTLGADAVSYVVSALSLVAVRTGTQPRREPRAAAEFERSQLRTLADEALAGIRLILAVPVQRLLLGVALALALVAGTIELLLATLAQIQLHLPAWQAGLIFGAGGVGGLLASALVPRLRETRWRADLALAGAVAAGGSLGLALAGSLGPHMGFAVALLANLLLDGAVSLGFILVGTQRMLITPRSARGRVNAANQLSSALARGLGLVAVGVLASRGSASPAFLALAASLVAAALLAGARASSTSAMGAGDRSV